jgi:hypothetical protein
MKRALSLPACITALVLALGLAGYGLFAALDLAVWGESAAVIADLAAGERNSLLKRSTPAPTIARIAYEVGDRSHRAALIRPGGGRARAGVVLVPGAVADGPDDPRLQAFAATLARAGFLILIPDSPAMRQVLLSPDDSTTIADAVAHLDSRRVGEGFASLGIAAVSYAVGPSVIAALRPDVRHKIAFVFGIGGYFDIVDTLRFLTTGAYTLRHLPGASIAKPDRRMVWRFLYHNAIHAGPPRDQVSLQALARVKLDNPGADVTVFARELGAEARALYALATNRDSGALETLLKRLPKRLHLGVEGLDLARRDLSLLEAKLLLVHGRDDPIVPAEESLRLAAAVPPGRARVYLIDSLVHAELDEIRISDVLNMTSAARELLRYRAAR